MRMYIPWGVAAIFISLYLFYEFNRVRKARHEERKEKMQQRRQELLDQITKSGDNKKNIEQE